MKKFIKLHVISKGDSSQSIEAIVNVLKISYIFKEEGQTVIRFSDGDKWVVQESFEVVEKLLFCE